MLSKKKCLFFFPLLPLPSLISYSFLIGKFIHRKCVNFPKAFYNVLLKNIQMKPVNQHREESRPKSPQALFRTKWALLLMQIKRLRFIPRQGKKSICYFICFITLQHKWFAQRSDKMWHTGKSSPLNLETDTELFGTFSFSAGESNEQQ